MKISISSMRERSRYLVYEVSSGSRFVRSRVVRAVWNSLVAFLGEAGVSKTSIMVLDWNDSLHRGIIKLNNMHVDEVVSGVSLISNIDNEKAAFHTIAVCGTIKKAKKILKEK